MEVAMSQKVLSARIQDHFQSLPDPRRLRVVYIPS
jgi:hypothetical protein